MPDNIPDMPPAQQEPGNNVFGLRSDLSEKDLEDTLANLRTLNAEQRVTVAETVFREFFLESFTDSTKIDKGVRAWAALINGFNRWANVHDSVTGVFLFEVPPLFNTDTFNAAAPTDLSVPTLNNVIEMAIQNTANRPMQRATVLRDSTLAYLVPRVNNRLRPDYVAAWRKIYAFYNIPFEMDQPEAGIQPEAKAAGKDDPLPELESF